MSNTARVYTIVDTHGRLSLSLLSVVYHVTPGQLLMRSGAPGAMRACLSVGLRP